MPGGGGSHGRFQAQVPQGKIFYCGEWDGSGSPPLLLTVPAKTVYGISFISLYNNVGGPIYATLQIAPSVSTGSPTPISIETVLLQDAGHSAQLIDQGDVLYLTAGWNLYIASPADVLDVVVSGKIFWLPS